MLRLKGFGAALAAMTLILAGGGATVRAATSAANFVGQWTPDPSSNAQLVGHVFSISTTSESSARNAAGQFTPSFDQYCASGSPTYFIVSYTWATTGTMGGCDSAGTKGHLFVWGTHDDVAYFRPVALKGEGILSGGWGPYQNNKVNYTKLKAHHPAAKFVAKVKSSSKKKGKSTVSTVSGSGALHVADTPASCVASTILSGIVPLSVRVTSGKSKLLDLKLGGGSAGGSYESCNSQSVLQSIPVVVKGSNRLQKVACKLGSTGTLSLTDKSGGDALSLSIPACHFSLSASGAKKGSKVTVAVTFNANGY